MVKTKKVNLKITLEEREGVCNLTTGKSIELIKEDVNVPVDLPDPYWINSKYCELKIVYTGFNVEKQQEEIRLSTQYARKTANNKTAFDDVKKLFLKDGWKEMVV